MLQNIKSKEVATYMIKIHLLTLSSRDTIHKMMCHYKSLDKLGFSLFCNILNITLITILFQK